VQNDIDTLICQGERGLTTDASRTTRNQSSSAT